VIFKFTFQRWALLVQRSTFAAKMFFESARHALALRYFNANQADGTSRRRMPRRITRLRFAWSCV
jgi:hypothetical protein